ncbi:peptide-methionine (S)-S-oxide reductase MsrA [Segetibacter koreensis]|uniref:peptide-methionine (S)-S-oxide reductase MsrA n=1 Tax=Segetibacter koreensis TaxID=398037 RepID=UPI00037DA35D|nr:peptide-methionine (S)-S-oxide reductase MsrA [Segetibacter koreensis]
MIEKALHIRFLLFINLVASVSIISCTQLESSPYKTANLKSMTNLKTDTATFGAGCFWCVEAVFQQLDGVLKVTSGYSGGHVANPTYEQVCSKKTGHVEVCRIVYDPAKITFDELLEVFWKTHDPTTPDQQGNDRGPQYRSVIFYHNEEQKKLAEEYKAALNKSGAWSKPVITGIEPLKNYYEAEDYHQNYYNTNPDQLYCRYVIQPKLDKFEKVFKNKLKGVKH